MKKLYYDICSNFKFKKNISEDDIFKLLNNYEISSYQKYSLNKCINLFIKLKRCENISKNTLGIYNCSLNKFYKFYKKNAIKKITKDTINDYIKYLSKNLKASSIQLHISVLKVFFEFLENESIIENNPCKQIKFQSKYNRRYPLSEGDIKILKNNCKTIRDKTLIELLLTTGCRVSEVINIKISDIDFNTNSINIIGKGNKQRVVLFNNKTKNLIKQNIKQSKNKEYLFSAQKYPYQKLERFAVNAIIKKLSEGINTKVSPHIFRHTFATIALNKGMNIISIQKLMGHDNISTTQLYAEVEMKNIRKQYNKIFN